MTITVSCPSCSTSFPVDPAKIPERGVNARCSSCGSVFFVERPTQFEEPAAAAPTPDQVTPAPEAQPPTGTAAAGTDAEPEEPSSPAAEMPEDAPTSAADEEAEEPTGEEEPAPGTTASSPWDAAPEAPDEGFVPGTAWEPPAEIDEGPTADSMPPSPWDAPPEVEPGESPEAGDAWQDAAEADVEPAAEAPPSPWDPPSTEEPDAAGPGPEAPAWGADAHGAPEPPEWRAEVGAGDDVQGADEVEAVGQDEATAWEAAHGDAGGGPAAALEDDALRDEFGDGGEDVGVETWPDAPGGPAEDPGDEAFVDRTAWDAGEELPAEVDEGVPEVEEVEVDETVHEVEGAVHGVDEAVHEVEEAARGVDEAVHEVEEAVPGIAADDWVIERGPEIDSAETVRTEPMESGEGLQAPEEAPPTAGDEPILREPTSEPLVTGGFEAGDLGSRDVDPDVRGEPAPGGSEEAETGADTGTEPEEPVRFGGGRAPETLSAPTEAPQAFQLGRRDPHEKAQRLARVLVSDMIMYNPERHSRALDNGTLEADFDDEIRKSWEEYVSQIGSDLARETSYFTDALNDILARGQRVFHGPPGA